MQTNPETRHANTLNPHPLDHPGTTKILLGWEESEIIADLGPFVLMVAVTADATTPPDARGRIVLHCLPCSKEALDGAFRVVSGKARAQTIKTPSSPSPEPTKEELRRA